MRNSVLATVLFGLLVHGTTAPAQDLIYASPRPTYSPAPNYPEAARTAGIQGIVAVQVQIDASGAVTDARVLNGPPELQASALQTAKDMEVRPDDHRGKGDARCIDREFDVWNASARCHRGCHRRRVQGSSDSSIPTFRELHSIANGPTATGHRGDNRRRQDNWLIKMGNPRRGLRKNSRKRRRPCSSERRVDHRSAEPNPASDDQNHQVDG